MHTEPEELVISGALMRCPALNELPNLQPGKTGWPWTADTTCLPDTMPDGSPWPAVSIVTPSLNQGRFIEETIRSVLLQGYPNLEYIIIDGGSSDNSLEIIKKYEPWLTYWISESDTGQSQALNKGFAFASGEVFGWLNSDDLFFPGAIAALMQFRMENPCAAAWVGACQEIDGTGKPLRIVFPSVGDKAFMANWTYEARFHQPACLFDSNQFRQISGVDEALHYALDADLWIRLSERGSFSTTHQVISCARIYPSIKSLRNPYMQRAELIHVCFKNDLPQVAQQLMVTYEEGIPLLQLVLLLLKRSRFRLRRWFKDPLVNFFKK